MRTLLDGEVHVHYGQMYVFSDGNQAEEGDEEFEGQRNGLCAAAIPGQLTLLTGLHTGNVPVTVELHETAPPVDESWEEIVEVSFAPVGSDIALVEWAGEGTRPLELEPIPYRVRYCAHAMDAARGVDTRLGDEPAVDRYLLQFWPAPHEDDEVVRQVSELATESHREVREDLPAQLGRTRASLLEGWENRVRRAHDRKREFEQREQEEQARSWGGRLPSDRLREAAGNASALARLDRDLVDEIEAASDANQRALARWAVHYAYRVAGLAEVSWIAPALAALDRGDPLPAPFDNFADIWSRFLNDQEALGTDEAVGPGVTAGITGGETPFDSDDPMPDAPEMDDPLSRKAAAIPALVSAVDDDPLRAACGAFHTAMLVVGADARADLLAEARGRLRR